MADLKYVFEVDDKDVLTTIKNHQILEKRITSLKGEYAKLDAATNKGKVSIQDYARATQQLDQKIDHLQATVRKGGSAVNQLATGMNVSGKAGRSMELQFQQAGYQLQDFIVQVQGGVNPLIAFSQQGSQLAGFFAGPWGAAIGLGIAAMSSLAMVMFSTAEETEKTVDVFKNLTEATKQLYTERMKLTDPKFDENLVGTQEELGRLTEAYEKAKVAAQGLATYGGKITGPRLFGIETGEAAAQAALEEAEAKLRTYNTEVGLAEARRLNNAIIDAQNEQGLRDLEEQQRLQDEFNNKLEVAYGIYARTRAEASGLADETARAIQALSQMKIEFSGGGAAMKKYGSRSTTDKRKPIFGNGESIYPKVSTSGGGRSRVAQIKETTIALDKETEANKRLEENMNAVSSNMTSAFMAMVEGSDSVVGAFRNMMYNILKSIYEQNVAKPLGNSISSLLFAGLSGGGPQTGSMGLPNFRFADGGVVGSPTTFQMSGGKTGLMGEAGPEAIMPLKRGSNGQLGVQVNGNSGGTTVNNNITVTGSDAAAVRMEVAKMIPQITNATKAAIIDAKRRGGQMGAAFQ